ncbi:hypothetical protein AAVH_06193 [Aphelenchoides avenae]|nr:hypothetical protein AAVH_32797 [Aphelenchus avenae]KAH7726392.1 hypothetical protein AAVH_06193 [Aphelenchus avenae]
MSNRFHGTGWNAAPKNASETRVGALMAELLEEVRRIDPSATVDLNIRFGAGNVGYDMSAPRSTRSNSSMTSLRSSTSWNSEPTKRHKSVPKREQLYESLASVSSLRAASATGKAHNGSGSLWNLGKISGRNDEPDNAADLVSFGGFCERDEQSPGSARSSKSVDMFPRASVECPKE